MHHLPFLGLIVKSFVSCHASSFRFLYCFQTLLQKLVLVENALRLLIFDLTVKFDDVTWLVSNSTGTGGDWRVLGFGIEG